MAIRQLTEQEKTELEALKRNAGMIRDWIRENVCPKMTDNECYQLQEGDRRLMIYPEGKIKMGWKDSSHELPIDQMCSYEELRFLTVNWSGFKKRICDFQKKEKDMHDLIMNFKP